MTSVFLPLPELKVTAAPSAAGGRTVSGETSGETSDIFSRMLDTVLGASEIPGESNILGESDTQAQNLPDLPAFVYIAAPLAPSPLNSAPEVTPPLPANPPTLPLTPPPVNPQAVLSSEAPLLTTAAPAEPLLPSPVADVPETFTLPVDQPAQATKTPAAETPQTPVATPDLAAPLAPALTPDNEQANIAPQAATMSVAAATNAPVQTTTQPKVAPDAPVVSAPPQTPQQGPVASADTPEPTPTVQAQAHVSQAQAPQIPLSAQAPAPASAFTQTQTQSAATPVAASETTAPHLRPATVQPEASPVTTPSGTNRVTAVPANIESPETGIADAPTPVVSAANPETVTTAAQAAIALPAQGKPAALSGSLPPAIDPEAGTTEDEPLTPAPHRAEAQAEGKAADANTPPVSVRHVHALSLKAEPAPKVAPAPAPEVASVPVAKPDTPSEQPQTQAPTQVQTQAQIPVAPPAADLMAPRAPLQPNLMAAATPPPAPQASTLSSHAVENIAALSAQITRKLSGKTTQFDMQLKPADQGRVDVRLEINADGKLSAHLSFDSPISESEFRGRQDELRRQLEQAGFQLEDGSLSFSSRERQQREGQGNPLPDNDFDIDTPAPLPVPNRPYAGAPLDGLYSTGQTLSLSLLV